MPARGVHQLAAGQCRLVTGEVLARADLLEGGMAQLAPARDQGEAPLVPTQLFQTLERLGQAILDEPGAGLPRLHQGIDGVGSPTADEDERRVGKELQQVWDAQHVLGGLVGEAIAAGEHPDREIDVRAFAVAHVLAPERVGVPAAVARMVICVPENVALAVDASQPGALEQQVEQGAGTRAGASQNQDRALGSVRPRHDGRQGPGHPGKAAAHVPDGAAQLERDHAANEVLHAGHRDSGRRPAAAPLRLGSRRIPDDLEVRWTSAA